MESRWYWGSMGTNDCKAKPYTITGVCSLLPEGVQCPLPWLPIGGHRKSTFSRGRPILGLPTRLLAKKWDRAPTRGPNRKTKSYSTTHQQDGKYLQIQSTKQFSHDIYGDWSRAASR